MVQLDGVAPTPVKISLLWAGLMSLYIYNDYFQLYVPGTIKGMAQGSMGPLGPYSEATMIMVALVLAIPASMVFMSSILSPRISRRLNLAIAAVYFAIACLTLIGSPLFYKMIVVFEIGTILLILRTAYLWSPEQASAA